MNYYNEIKNKLIDDEIYSAIYYHTKEAILGKYLKRFLVSHRRNFLFVSAWRKLQIC